MVNCPWVDLGFGEERRWEPQSVFFLHFNDCLLCQKKWYHFHSDEFQSRAATTSAFACRSLCKSTRCSSVEKEVSGKNSYWRVQTGPDSGGTRWLVHSQVLARARGQMGSSAAIWARYEPQHLLSQPAFTPSIFRANGPSQGRSLTCNSPLM